MPFTFPLEAGSRVIRCGDVGFHALIVEEANDRFIVARHPRLGECGGPPAQFIPVPDDWQDPPPAYVSEASAVEARYDARIKLEELTRLIREAETRDHELPALLDKLQAAEAWLAWVQAHLYPLSPQRFEPQLLAARAARDAAQREVVRAEAPAIAAE
jgi:hypothetical protein